MSALCLVCGVKPKYGDTCYYPAPGNNADNKIVGHKECIDHAYKEYMAKSSAEAREAHLAAKNVLPLPAAPKVSAKASDRPTKVPKTNGEGRDKVASRPVKAIGSNDIFDKFLALKRESEQRELDKKKQIELEEQTYRRVLADMMRVMGSSDEGDEVKAL
jgi:hypothetical protein